MKNFRLIIIGVLFCVLGSLGISAQIRDNNIVVSVTPDHQNWNCQAWEKAHFTVNARHLFLSKKYLLNYYIYL